MIYSAQIKQVFRISNLNKDIICPPSQVFINPTFDFTLTMGGHLTYNDKEYDSLMQLLKQLGENEFYIMENIGATKTNKTMPFKAKIPVASNFEYFDKIVREYDPPFGFSANHFFIFGKNPNWGIYICEFPTINIIGCIPSLKGKFRKIFGVSGDGYSALAPFMAKEFSGMEDLKSKFIINYRLKA